MSWESHLAGGSADPGDSIGGRNGSATTRVVRHPIDGFAMRISASFKRRAGLSDTASALIKRKPYQTVSD